MTWWPPRAARCIRKRWATPARSTRWPPACWSSASATPRACSTTSSTTTRRTRRRSGSGSPPTPTTPTARRSRRTARRRLPVVPVTVPGGTVRRRMRTGGCLIAPPWSARSRSISSATSNRCRMRSPRSKSTASGPMTWPAKARRSNSRPAPSRSASSRCSTRGTGMRTRPVPARRLRRRTTSPRRRRWWISMCA